MKNTNNNSKKPMSKLNNNKVRPEIRDNLDSREHEEQSLKGNDITHNRKEHRKPVKKSKND